MVPMGLLKSILRPFSRPAAVVANPTIGFLNLLGGRGDVVVSEDRARLAPLFAKSKLSSGIVPHCEVLLIYADLDVAGHFAGSPFNLADIVNKSAAHIIVIATANPSDCIAQAAKPTRTRPVNIVFTLDRGKGVFAAFFAGLFTRMFEGESMPNAWATLAPDPGAKYNAPGVMMIPEAGQVTFVRPGI